MMPNSNDVLDHFIKWAKDTDLIRCAILTGSRVNPNPCIDFLSDYDIELFVSDIDLFSKNDDWAMPFGTIMIRWPHKPASTFDPNWITRLFLFKNGVRIDFQITIPEYFQSDGLGE